MMLLPFHVAYANGKEVLHYVRNIHGHSHERCVVPHRNVHLRSLVQVAAPSFHLPRIIAVPAVKAKTKPRAVSQAVRGCSSFVLHTFEIFYKCFLVAKKIYHKLE